MDEKVVPAKSNETAIRSPAAVAFDRVSVTVRVAPEVAFTWTNETLADALTVTLDVPLWPSLVAVIVTGPPAATPVTTPLPLTVASAVLLEAQVITRPVSTFPPASFVVAVSGTVPPTTTDAGLGATVTVATGTGAPAPAGRSAAMMIAQPELAVAVAA
ncbi:MAG TPA: hypothetical protein VMT77_05050 [Gemmatimonadales bacterium]|nr:hypothetical protein [Gemmatimonadales bacterium]